MDGAGRFCRDATHAICICGVATGSGGTVGVRVDVPLRGAGCPVRQGVYCTWVSVGTVCFAACSCYLDVDRPLTHHCTQPRRAKRQDNSRDSTSHKRSTHPQSIAHSRYR